MALRKDIACDVLVSVPAPAAWRPRSPRKSTGSTSSCWRRNRCSGWATTASPAACSGFPGNGRKQDPPTSRSRARTPEGRPDPSTTRRSKPSSTGPQMVDFFERETEVKFVPTLYPDYHPTRRAASTSGRSILAAPFEHPRSARTWRGCGRRSRPSPSSDDVQLVERGPEALLPRDQIARRPSSYVAKRLASHVKELCCTAAACRSPAATHWRRASPSRRSTSAFRSTRTRRRDGANRREADASRARGHGRRATYQGAPRAWCWPAAAFRTTSQRIAQGLSASRGAAASISRRRPRQHRRRRRTWRKRVGGACDIRFPEPAAWMPVSRVPSATAVRRVPAPARPLQAGHHRRDSATAGASPTNRTRITTSAPR